MPRTLVYIVEDDTYYSEFIRYSLKLSGDCNVECFTTAKELMRNLDRSPDIITLDYGLPDINGDEILKRIKSISPSSDVLVISGQEDVETALKMLHGGAVDYIVKNNEAKNKIVHRVNKILSDRQILKQSEKQDKLLQQSNPKAFLLSSDQSMETVYHMIDKAAKSAINVSIYGETGTGKELVATAVHYCSSRSKEPFVALNLTAVPEGLIESELYGHAKGAFTGADRDRIGKIEEAGGGTLFLDEIAEIPLHIQAKLLRVLQERKFSRVGENKVRNIQCRIICASHKDLLKEVEKSKFRQDLFYRLVGIPIHLPNLVERGKDITQLAKHFVRAYSEENELGIMGLTREAINKLSTHSWPGNIRELKATVELACVLAENDLVQDDDILFNGRDTSGINFSNEMSLKEMNEKIIFNMLDKHGNNVRRVARILDIGKSTIYRLMKEKEDTDNGMIKAV